MGEVARMKLTPENMRAMCDWVVADKTIGSHTLNTIGEKLLITIDTPQGMLSINEGQWLTKDEDGTFKVINK